MKPRPVVRPLPIAHKTPQEGGGGASSHGAGQGGSSLENLSKVKVGSNDASYDHHNGKSKGGRGHKKEYEPPFAEEMHTYPEVLNVKTLGEGDMMHLNSGFSDMVYIGRDDKDPKGRGRFGNPFPIGRFYGNRHDVIARHRKWLASAILYTKTGDALLKDIRDTIGGKKPVCFCAPEACHGDFLRLVANCPEKDLHDFLAHYAG